MSGDSGWHAVIHHPAELELPNWDWDGNDGETDRELPSTVDMGAIKDSGPWDPVANGTTSENSEDDSESDDDSSGGSDGSNSCSDSNSDSDNDSSDSESNSDYTSDHSEQTFAVEEGNADQGGLKLKISMKVPKKEDFDKLRSDKVKRLMPRKNKSLAAKSSDCSSDDSDSSIIEAPVLPIPNQMLRQQQKPQPPASHLARLQQQNNAHLNSTNQTLQSPSKMLPQSIKSHEPYSSNQPSVIQSPQQPQQPLQELNQEDLAALLPNEQDHSDAVFDGFEDSESGRLVSKAIERMSLSADSDSSENVNDRNSMPVYSSSLLEQFAEKTALLSEQQSPRKRGRSSKQITKKPSEPEYVSSSNVSPDSGIQSVDNSPLHQVNPTSPPVMPVSNSSSASKVVVSKTDSSPSTNHSNVQGSTSSTSATITTSPSSMTNNSSSGKVIQMSQAATVAAALAAKAKPVVNVDRVMEQPPKRKPGRPAKHQQSGSQSRGPGRPPKKDNARNQTSASAINKDNPCLKRAKIVVAPCSSKSPVSSSLVKSTTSEGVTLEEKIDRRKKARKSLMDAAPSTTKHSAKNQSVDVSNKVCLTTRKKCSNKLIPDPSVPTVGSKRTKEISSLDNEQPNNSKRIKYDKTVTAKKEGKRKSKSADRTNESIGQLDGKKSSKENRHDTTSVPTSARRPGRKPQQSTQTQTTSMTTTTSTATSRRVLKENKANKKVSGSTFNNNEPMVTSGIGVQTIISLPVINPMKNRSSKRRHNAMLENGKSHHRHHHRHRRRFHMAPKTPIQVDPAVGQELERLIEEFTKLCSLGRIGTVGPHNNNNEEANTALAVGAQIGELLPQIFHTKKNTKKRKNDKLSLLDNSNTGKVQKRRCKSQKASSSSSCSSASSTSGASVAGTESSNPNEQRLPLKKRHYHVFSNNSHSNSQERRGDEPDHDYDDEEEVDDDEVDEDDADDDEQDDVEEMKEQRKQQSLSRGKDKSVEKKKEDEKASEIDQREEYTANSSAMEKKKRQKENSTHPTQSNGITNSPDSSTTPTAFSSFSAATVTAVATATVISTLTSTTSANKTENENGSTNNDKLSQLNDQQTKRKKTINEVKDLRVTVTKLSVENNHIVDKIDKIEKMCAGDKTVKSFSSDKSTKIDKSSSGKIAKNYTEKSEKAETRSSEHHLRPLKNKQKEDKEPTSNKSNKKDTEVNNKVINKKDTENNTAKNSKKEFENNKSTKKDIDSSPKNMKKDSESGKSSLLKKDQLYNSPQQIKKDSESLKSLKKDSESKKPDNNKHLQDLIKNSEVVLTKTPTVTCESPALSFTSVSTSTSGSLATIIKKKIRRRKTINRTGFPTIKKKKKKLISTIESLREDMNTPSSDMSSIPEAKEVKKCSLKVTELKTARIELEKQEIPLAKNDLKETNSKRGDSTSVESGKKMDLDTDEPMSWDNDSVCLEERMRTCSALSKDSEIECDGTKPCDKLCPVKYEKVQDSRMYDENATLEESLERYNQSQKIAVLSEENLRKLECANSHVSVKIETHAYLNNNHRRMRGSASPCPLTVRNLKRLKNEYDTESDAVPSSDVASDDQNKPTTGRRRKQPRWKKNYLPAGLFSNYYKEDELRKASNADSGSSKNKLTYDPAEHPHGLLPPPYHCGKFLRQRKIPFQLPYDLWWLHTHSRLPGRDLVPSWNYRKIRSNVYYDVKPATLYEAQACECKPETGCGDDCINRMVFSECSPQLCPCIERCKNQRIQKHDWAPGLKKFMTESKGWGICTQQPIKPGEFILEYVGEVVSEREFKSRMATRYANDTHHYCLHLDGGLVIDGHRMGGDGRFVNHSCEPNCEMQKWSVHGLPRMALFASRHIQAGEELTYDYNFALFNPSEGQECRCGSNVCRGVIGGKSQRVPRISAAINSSTTASSNNSTNERRSVGRPRKNARKGLITQASPIRNDVPANDAGTLTRRFKGIIRRRRFGPDGAPLSGIPPFKLSNQQRCFIQEHHCFLIRNIERMRKRQMLSAQLSMQNKSVAKAAGPSGINSQSSKERITSDGKINSEVIFTNLTALTNPSSRTVRTRRLAQAQDDPEVNKTAKLAKVLKDLYTVLTSAKDENDELLCSPFIALPSKRKVPEYYEKVLEPIDLTTIDQNIEAGHYKTAEQFDQDVIKLFENNVRFFGRTSDIGIAAARLRKIYLSRKVDFVSPITEATGLPPSQAFLPPRGSTAGEEDVIRCICGLHRDEGLMIQCERCLVWQHCDCVRADASVESYMCERCQPREVDYEIPLENEEEEDGKKYYVTLMRDDLQLRTGDTIYVLRDTPDKNTYKTIEKFNYEEMDIFRIERLWKNEKGERFVFGHHYLRPHETYHEPTRKFYKNELVCAPLYEAVPCDLVAGRCWVLDPHTFCKGRPIGAPPEHIYICEYRVDRAAKMFTKVARARHQICTKPYAFETFVQRLKIYRDYFPHHVDKVLKNTKEKKKTSQDVEQTKSKSDSREYTKSSDKDQPKPRGRRKLIENSSITTHIKFVQRETRKKKLNTILLNLLDKMPNKNDPLDVTNLLDRNRRNRKRPGILNP
ncbi:hypothetical protein TKK_0007242 [Trichogramma kaykai]|uniref:Histone-lysine N-methyltransferase n=1 Tax=Trichogramma kaykai TaxID=54128 RepID=A0ABD2XA65_9HYME